MVGIFQQQANFVKGRISLIPGEVEAMFPNKLRDIATGLLTKHSNTSLAAAIEVAKWAETASFDELIKYTQTGLR